MKVECMEVVSLHHPRPNHSLFLKEIVNIGCNDY